MAGVGRRYREALADHRRAQQHYWDPAGQHGLPGFGSYVNPPYGDGGDFFYDDNEWVAGDRLSTMPCTATRPR